MDQKVTKKDFGNGLKILKKTYLKFDLDVKDDQALRLWYSHFKYLTQKDFQLLIDKYIQSEKFAPQSPNCLLQYSETYLSEKNLKKLQDVNMKVYGKHYQDYKRELRIIENGQPLPKLTF